MGAIRHLPLDTRPESSVAEIPLPPFALTGKESGPRAAISLHRAGHLGFDTDERRARRRRFLGALGIDERRVYGCRQIHSRAVIEVTGRVPAECNGIEADGLVTTDRRAVLSVTAADCLPVWITHPRDRVRALVHSGWRGTGIVLDAIALIEERCHVPRGELRLVIGPGIGPCCYAVSAERYREFVGRFGEESGRTDGNRFFLDLRRANLALLERLGVDRVDVIETCTCCEPLLGSYRRDGREKFSNMLALFGDW